MTNTPTPSTYVHREGYIDYLYLTSLELPLIMEYVVPMLKSLASGLSDDRSSPQSTVSTAQKALLSIFALTGIYVLLSKVISFVRLIFSLFIIPGKPVRLAFTPTPNPFKQPKQLFFFVCFNYLGNVTLFG